MSEVFLAEPPAIYQTRAPLVINASLLASVARWRAQGAARPFDRQLASAASDYLGKLPAA
jgi:hypothetical protein